MDTKLKDPFQLNMEEEFPFELMEDMLKDINLNLNLVHIQEGKQEVDYLDHILLDKHVNDLQRW